MPVSEVLACDTAMWQTSGMKETNTKSSSQGVRLSYDTWPDLRFIIQQGGRKLLEQWILKTAKRMKEKK